jgi:L-fucose isomerase-like protein
MRELRVALVPLARVNFDMELAAKMARTLRTNLIFRGFKVVGDGELVTDLGGLRSVAGQLGRETFDLLLVFQASFADSTLVTALAEASEQPIFIWGVPEAATGERLRLGSLCGVNLTAHALTLRGRRYDYVYAHPDDSNAIERLRTVTVAAQVSRRLKTARIGVVGEHPAGMDTCRLDEDGLKEIFGLQVVKIPLDVVFERMRRVEPSVTGGIKEKLEKRVARLDDLEQGPLHRTLGAYQVLNEIAREEKLDGLAVRCWPEFFTEMHCSACGALSLLSDQQTPSSCEADVNGTVTQLILQWLSGQPAFGTDIVAMDEAADTTVLWHCGQAPLSMADPGFQPRGTIHSNRRLPLLMEFPLKPGRVTLARLSQATEKLSLVVGRGEMLSAPPSFAGTSGVIRFERPAGQVLDTLLSRGLEHHLSLTYGDYSASLLSLAKIHGLSVLAL